MSKKKSPTDRSGTQIKGVAANSNHTEKVKSQVKPLAKKFHRGGFDFEQVHRQGRIAIFQKRKSTWPSDVFSWEVVRIQIYPATKIFGRKLPLREAFPSSESWGTHGFTYQSLESALTRFHQMAKEAGTYCTGDVLRDQSGRTPVKSIKRPQRTGT